MGKAAVAEKAMLVDAHAHLDGYDELGPAALDAALERASSGTP